LFDSECGIGTTNRTVVPWPGREHWLTTRMRSSSSRRRLPTNRSAVTFARGAWIGVVRTSMAAALNLASKTRLNL